MQAEDGRGVDQIDDESRRHPALDGRTTDLAVALCGMAVPDAEQCARNQDGQEQR
jgi:hypothetical protein